MSDPPNELDASIPEADPVAGPDVVAVESHHRGSLRFELAVVLAITLLPPVVSGLVGNVGDPSSPIWLRSVWLTIATLQFGLPVLALVRVRTGSFGELGWTRFRPGADLGLTVAAAFLMLMPYLAFDALVESVAPWFASLRPREFVGPEPPPRQWFETPIALAAGAVDGLLVASVMFAYITSALRRLGASAWVAALAGSLVYGITHSGNSVYLAAHFTVAGLGAAILFTLTRRVWPLVIAISLWTSYGLIFW